MSEAQTTFQSKILIVDDEPRVLRSLKAAFKFKYNITQANNASEAKAILKAATQKFEVIISDERMPGQLGHSFLKWAKENYPHSTRILLSSGDFNQLKQSLIPAEIFKCLSKPWDIKQVEKVIDEAIIKSCESQQQANKTTIKIENKKKPYIMAILEQEQSYRSLYQQISQNHNQLFETHFFNTTKTVNEFFSKNTNIGIFCIDLFIGESEAEKLIHDINQKYQSACVIVTAKPAQLKNFIQLKKLNIHEYRVKPLSLTRLQPVISDAVKKYLQTIKKKL